ncbi:MAG: ABC transporter substrate-binding protein [Clostridia bacterium]|nr:ABC transporter substrate-binding protein [Clostridia bacterium]
MKNRIIALLLCLSCLIGLCACGSNGSSNKNKDEAAQNGGKNTTVSIAYNNTDSFNPYVAETSLNRNVAALIFDSLFYIDNDYNLQNNLADSYEINEKVCTVTLKSATFSDGTALTADDVVYSFNAAKNSSKRYKQQLKSIVDATANGNTVTFTCSKIDAYMVNLLTFPIIKKGSDKLTNEDKIAFPPIGCGRYTLSQDKTTLTANKKWHGGKLSIKTIRLINAPDQESLSHAVEIGAIDIYYTDLSDGTILRMSGTRQDVNLNNLVYVGINHSSSLMKNNNMRQAISAALDRKKICESAYFTNAVPATGIFNPAWEPTKSIQTIQTSANSEISIENLEEIGYNKKDNGVYYENANGDTITVRLLVNSENQFRLNLADMVVAQLKSVGIKVIVDKVSYKKYVTRLKQGNFDLYIGEVNILDNMDMTELLCAGGKAAYGIKKSDTTNKTTQNMIKSFYSGKATVADIAAYAISEMPIIPICYRTGVLLCCEDVTPVSQAYSGNIYYPVNSMKIN